MKSTRNLLVGLILTVIASIGGISASTYPVMGLFNVSVPGFNGSYTSPSVNIDTAQMGRHHMVNNVSVTRELDIQVRKHESSGTIAASWEILANGQVTQLTNSLSAYNFYMQGGTFDLYIDSRWHYTSATTINSANWYLDSLT